MPPLRMLASRAAVPTRAGPARAFRTTPRALRENHGHSRKYAQPEIMPLYILVATVVGFGIYSASKHLFEDNDIRRVPEHPVDAQGNPTHEPQRAPIYKPTK